MMDSLVLLSGGLDSSAQLAFAHAEGRVSFALNINYGQKAADSELKASKLLCEYYNVKLVTLDLTWLGGLGGSSLTALTSEMCIPEVKADELDDLQVTQKTMKSVWVPNRNGILLNVAGAFAEREGLRRVLIGFNKEEAATFPDNSRDFLDAVNDSFYYSTCQKVLVDSYTTDLMKSEIVSKLDTLHKKFPFHLVWSCYHSGEGVCGKCESCQRFKRAVGDRRIEKKKANTV